MAGQRRWIVTLSPDRPAAEVRKDLAEAGFAIEQRLDGIGVVIGVAEEAVARKLRTVPGVADVSRDMPTAIARPEPG